MKNLFFLGILMFFVQWAWGQTFTAKFSNNSAEKKIFLKVSKGDIDISTHNSPEVIIETNDYEPPPERAKGLRPLYNNAVDNTGIGLDVSEAGNVISIKKASHHNMNFSIKVPENVNVELEERGWESDAIKIEGVKGEIEVKCNGSDISILNASGPVIASTVNGDIEVVFSSLNQEQPNSMNCTNGFLDVTLPGNAKTDIKLKSINGEIYTDLELEMGKKKDDMHRIGGRNIFGTLNGGGVEISLRTINNDIYLRKAK